VARAHVGRVGFSDGDEPTVLPVNFVLDTDVSPPAIVFCSTVGSKLAAAVAGRRLAFQVDGIEPTSHGGWSVLLRGWAEVVEDPRELERLRRLPLRPWWPPARDRWVRIPAERVSGRRLGQG